MMYSAIKSTLKQQTCKTKWKMMSKLNDTTCYSQFQGFHYGHGIWKNLEKALVPSDFFIKVDSSMLPHTFKRNEYRLGFNTNKYL